MLFLRRLLLLFPWVRRARERELEEELRAHLDLAADEARAGGLADEEARAVARRDAIGLQQAREEARGVWGFRALERVLQDLRYALRTARRSPGFTSVAVASTAAGIAAATVVFSLVQAVLLKPLPYPNADRIVYLREVVPPLAHLYPTLPVNAQHFRTWKREARSFEAIAAVNTDTVTVTGTGEPERVDLIEASADFLPLLGLNPQVGRGIAADDEARRNRVAVISYSLWQRRFGGTADVLGRPLVLDGLPYTIAGVLPPSFWFPSGADLGPLARLGKTVDVIRPLGTATWLSQGWGGDYDLIVLGRLRAGVSADQARAELDAIETRIVSTHQGVSPGLHVMADPLQKVITAPVRTGLYLLLLSVLALVAVVCVNLAALLLARTLGRAREFSIRTAIGAGRARLFQQVVLETLLLVSVGGAIGIAVAVAALRGITASTVIDLPRGALVRVDGSVVQFALLLVFACALLVAWLPAFHMAGADSQSLLRVSGGSTGSGRALRMRGWLVGAETALSTILLIGAGLLIASLARVLHVDRGFQAEHAIAARLTIPESRYPSPDSRIAFFERTLEQLRVLPGVTSAAFVNGLPLTGESQVNGIQLEGSDAEALDPATRELIIVNVRFVSPEYFQTLGIPLKSGRRLEWSDRHTRRVAVISERLAAKVWPGRDPIGRRFATGSGVGQVEVVGIVGDVHNASLEGPATPIVYVPFWVRGPLSGDVVVSTASDERALAPSVRRAVWTTDPAVPVSATRTIGEVLSEAVARRRFQVQMAAGFAGAALLLTMLGIYGIAAYSAAQRRKEIGIRMALGASRRDIVATTIRTGLQPVALGLVAGVAIATTASRLIHALLFGVSPRDPMVIGGTVAVLGLVALLATFLPARAASRIDPLQVLRMD